VNFGIIPSALPTIFTQLGADNKTQVEFNEPSLISA
jgi:hypothetical protein